MKARVLFSEETGKTRHAPAACAFYALQNITSNGRKNLFHRGILMPSALAPHFESTDIGQAEAVFGGMDLLREKVRQALERKPGAVIVVSSCVAGIIGDDIRSVEEMGTPEIPVIAIPADGDISGDYMEGIRIGMDAAAERLIDPAVKPEGRFVNIVGETGVSNNIEYNFRVVERMLGKMDIRVNCRYLGDADCGEMKQFLRAPLNLLASGSEDNLKRKQWLEERYGCRFLEETFPVGCADASAWLRKIGTFFGREAYAETVIAEEQAAYREEIRKAAPALRGKTVVMTTINSNLDWLLSAAQEAGMRFLWIGVLNYLHQEINVTSIPEIAAVTAPEFDWKTLHDKVKELHPDLVLSNYTSVLEDCDVLQDQIPMIPAAGFQSGVLILKRWAGLFTSGKGGSWADDRALFSKYYS